MKPAQTNSPALWQKFVRPKTGDANKYAYGHALIYGGAQLTGAARLAGHAALRMGAGLCTIAASAESANVYRTSIPEIMVEEQETSSSFKKHFADTRRNAILIGPGAGLEDEPGLRRAVSDACQSGRPCVIDADGLTCFQKKPSELLELLHEKNVLTPHEGEFARIFPQINGLKTDRALAAARLSGAAVLLKGADTIIAAPDGRVVINNNAPPTLATGGAGDVLAGMILGLLAQGVPAFEAACAGAWIHGAAASLFGPGLIASDIIDGIPRILRDLT